MAFHCNHLYQAQMSNHQLPVFAALGLQRNVCRNLEGSRALAKGASWVSSVAAGFANTSPLPNDCTGSSPFGGVYSEFLLATFLSRSIALDATLL